MPHIMDENRLFARLSQFASSLCSAMMQKHRVIVHGAFCDSKPLAEDIAQRYDILGQAISSQNLLPARGTDAAAQAAVVLQSPNSGRQLLGAGGRNQKAADPVLNQLRNPMDARG